MKAGLYQLLNYRVVGLSRARASRLLHEKFESYTAFNHVFPERNGFLLKTVRCSIVTLSEFSADSEI